MVNSNIILRVLFGVLVSAMILGLVFPTGTRAQGGEPVGPDGSPNGPKPLRPEVSRAVMQDISPPLSNIPPIQAQTAGDADFPLGALPLQNNLLNGSQSSQEYPALQNWMGTASMPAPNQNFEGVHNRNDVLPPDTNGDVGPNHYIQWVNLSFAIWDKNGNLLYGPAAGNSLWAGFGGICQSHNDGDPIVLYDHLADRWLMSQFGLSFPSKFYQCVAISQTPDPTGPWHRYAFLLSTTKMNDYPKLGVWPDGYYLAVNQFAGSWPYSWRGQGVAVFERDKMLAGLPARQVYFDLYDQYPDLGGMLPADLDGPPPPPGTPNSFLMFDDDNAVFQRDQLQLWEFQVNWGNPANSTFVLKDYLTSVGQPMRYNLSFDSNLCGGSLCVPQPNTNQKLDTISDRLMYRLQYRNFGGYQAMVTNQTVDVGDDQAGVQWYELRNSGSGWFIHQAGVYAPDDDHRWMGSIAMDRVGNLALGYSVSGISTYPSIRYAGRLSDDPLDALSQREMTLMAGTGSQLSSYGRWGDYSSMMVDPLDDCTFWFTSEYLLTSSPRSWHTRIGSFTQPSCMAGPKGDLWGKVTDRATGQPVKNVLVEVGAFKTLTNEQGVYEFYSLPVERYTITTAAYGYEPVISPSIQVFTNDTTIHHITLVAVPRVDVSGVVSDGTGHGWPLYARIDIAAPGYSETFFTHPVQGTYQVSLVEGTPHSLMVEAVIEGYESQTVLITPTVPSNQVNIALAIDNITCTAPGYAAIPDNCSVQPGGLLTGNVFDANTGVGIVGATVANQQVLTETTVTLATPYDPFVPDGYFALFSPSIGENSFLAVRAYYGTVTQTVKISKDTLVTADFHLPAGRLASDPATLRVTVPLTRPLSSSLALLNVGDLPANFEITKVNSPNMFPEPTGPFATATRHVSPKRLEDRTAEKVYGYNLPEAQALPAGQVMRSWETGLESLWGIGFDIYTGDLWLGSGDFNYQSTPYGELTGARANITSQVSFFAADMTYNPLTRTFWQVNVSGENCIFEIDPRRQSPTGRTICPAFGNSQRGLAFDPTTNTYYSASWTDGILYHFDSSGNILDSLNLDLPISGLAFNPSSQHLFALTNAVDESIYDVYVLDAGASYEVLGGFDIAGLGSFEGAGLAMDCQGRLWVANQIRNVVLEAESGETGACAWNDIPWLSILPLEGSIHPASQQTITVTLDARQTTQWAHTAYLVIASDNTPYEPLMIPVTLWPSSFRLFMPVISIASK